MKTTEIRRRFLEYFAVRGHEIMPSSSLVPGNDATLLFTNSGMVQFKDVFLGLTPRETPRAVTAQRCVRAGGKHNDLENVGYTARHHTFFEMLGNFSFGDYFKAEAIQHAWQLLTEEFNLPRDRLWVTVYEEDDEAERIWLNDIGVPKKRLRRIGANDNFWAMGDTGPCGPCSEIFYDHGAKVQGGPPGSKTADGDRFVEIWNLVFMQYERAADGALTPLPKPSVDTGMGLERIAAVLQGVQSNYDIDLFRHLIKQVAATVCSDGGGDIAQQQSLRVIADHIRSTAFLLVDGVTPSNEGRGYVLRRIIRRAVRHGYQLGRREPFMHLLVEPLIVEMGDAGAELAQQRQSVERALLRENEKFVETLEQGLQLLDREIADTRGKVIAGEAVFRLYDTYGFPPDLTADVAREHNLTIDTDAFDRAMNAQRTRARAAGKFSRDKTLRVADADATEFIGHQTTRGDAEVIALFVEQDNGGQDGGEQDDAKQNDGAQAVQQLQAGQRGVVVLQRTPFYAESGGQVGDCGELRGASSNFAVDDTQYLANRVIGHIGAVQRGAIAIGDAFEARVAKSARRDCANNHSATHLLHAALKKVLGAHVQQKGSLVTPARLRFDFAHGEAVGATQLREVEQLVNQHIRANHAVAVNTMELEKAKADGAEALFGEKYDKRVRVVRMGEFSFELCGGTHVGGTGEIGFFKITGESAVAAGVRRIEAVSGAGAERWVTQQLTLLAQTAGLLKTSAIDAPQRIESLLDAQQTLRQKIESLQGQLAGGNDAKMFEVNGVHLAVLTCDDVDAKLLRRAADGLRQKLGSGVALVIGASDKTGLIAAVTSDLTKRYSARELINALLPMIDGRGGGKAELAQGGGAKPCAPEAIEQAARQWLTDATQ